MNKKNRILITFVMLCGVAANIHYVCGVEEGEGPGEGVLLNDLQAGQARRTTWKERITKTAQNAYKRVKNYFTRPSKKTIESRLPENPDNLFAPHSTPESDVKAQEKLAAQKKALKAVELARAQEIANERATTKSDTKPTPLTKEQKAIFQKRFDARIAKMYPTNIGDKQLRDKIEAFKHNMEINFTTKDFTVTDIKNLDIEIGLLEDEVISYRNDRPREVGGNRVKIIDYYPTASEA